MNMMTAFVLWLSLVHFTMAGFNDAQNFAIQQGFKSYLAHYHGKKRAQIQLFPEEEAESVIRWIRDQKASDLHLSEEQKNDLFKNQTALKEEILRLFGDAMQESPESKSVSLEKKQKTQPAKSQLESLPSGLFGEVCRHFTTATDIHNLMMASRQCNDRITSVDAGTIITGPSSGTQNEWIRYRSYEDFKKRYKNAPYKNAVVTVRDQSELYLYLGDPDFQKLEGIELSNVSLDQKYVDRIRESFKNLKVFYQQEVGLTGAIARKSRVRTSNAPGLVNFDNLYKVQLNPARNPKEFNEQLTQIPKSPSVASLRVYLDPTTTPVFLLHIPKLTHIRKLGIYFDFALKEDSEILKKILIQLASLTQLTSLKLDEVPVDDETVQQLGNTLQSLRRLETLSVAFSYVTRQEEAAKHNPHHPWESWVKAFSLLSRLQYLTLRHAPEEEYLFSQAEKSLRHLAQVVIAPPNYYSDNPPVARPGFHSGLETRKQPLVSLAQFNEICKKRKERGLSCFNFSYEITDVYSLIFSNEDIYIESYDLHLKDLQTLDPYFIPSLKSVTLIENKLEAEGIKYLTKLLAQCPELEVFNIVRQNFSNPLLYEYLTQALSNKKKLRAFCLILSDPKEFQGIEPFLSALAKLNLEAVDLGDSEKAAELLSQYHLPYGKCKYE